MIEWPLILLGGLLGSSHCLGMCGPFAVMIGAGARGWKEGFVRQLIYSVGRICTYAFGGAVAGFLGLRLSRQFGSLGGAQGMLSILAGVLLVIQGILAAGWFRSGGMGGSGGGVCGSAKLFATFLRHPRGYHVFLAGILTGFLPCGLVYAYLSLAAATGDIWRGLAVMAVFGAGTVPVMALTGTGARLMNLAFRRRMFQIAAACVIFTGLITVARGAWFVGSAGSSEEEIRCPACLEAAQNRHNDSTIP